VKPEVGQILGLCAQQLMGSLAPLLPTGYAQGAAALTSFMLVLSAEEYDRAAEIRVADNADMRALFKELVPHVGNATLKSRLEAAAAARDTSLKIPALDEANYELRRLLIALHIHVEALKDLRDAEKRIWEVLKASADRRVLKIPGT
jgi:hypothetical protein